jgi:hypothetical protein
MLMLIVALYFNPIQTQADTKIIETRPITAINLQRLLPSCAKVEPLTYNDVFETSV